MVSKTRKARKVSKRVMEMMKDPETVWGKNPALERFWGELASGKYVIVIDKNGDHRNVNLPKRFTQKYETLMTDFNKDDTIVAILTSNPSQDAYEQYLYPKAKSKTPDYVVKYYKKYFKPMTPGEKVRVPL